MGLTSTKNLIDFGKIEFDNIKNGNVEINGNIENGKTSKMDIL